MHKLTYLISHKRNNIWSCNSKINQFSYKFLKLIYIFFRGSLSVIFNLCLLSIGVEVGLHHNLSVSLNKSNTYFLYERKNFP
jgi:hypothetical protein